MAFSFFARRIGKASVRLKNEAFTRIIDNRVREFGEQQVLPMYKEGVWNWEPEHQPHFSLHYYQMLNSFRIAVGTDSENYDIYRYVDQGTSIRWAIMSSDWVSKTDKSRYYSIAGQGEVVARGKSYMTKHGLGPKQGLEPRNFTRQIMEIMTPKWKLWMRYAVRDARIAMENESNWGKQ